MATLEELVVELVAETSGLRAELDKATKATSQASSKMDDAIKSFTENSSKNVGFFQSAMATATGFLGSQAVLGAFGLVKDAASMLWQEMVVNGVAAATQQEDSLQKLNTALAMTGQYSKKTSDEMNDFAAQIQATTKYEDDQVLASAALIQSLGGLEKDGLKRATMAAVELSAVLGKDLQTTSMLVGKAAAGNVDAFKKFGIEVEAGATKAQTFENMLRAVEGRMGGSAAAQVKTYSGQVTLLQHNWGEATEVVGNAIIKNQALLNILGELNKIVMGGTKELEDNKKAMSSLIGEGLVGFVDILGVGTQTLDIFVRSVQFLAGALGVLLAPLHLVAAGLEALISGTDAATAQLQEYIDTTTKDLNSFGESGNGVLYSMSQKFAELSVAGQNGLDAIAAGAEASVEPLNNAKVATEELTAAELERNKVIEQFAESLAQKTTDQEAYYETELEMLQAQLEAKKITQDEYDLAAMEALVAKQEAEMLMLDNYNKLKGANDKTYADAKTALIKKQQTEQMNFGNAMLKYEATTNKLREQNLKDTLSTMATLSQSGNKTLAAIGKASAISVATIDGFAAIQKALAAAPPPINFVLAAAVGAATAVNIAKIAGVGLNKGGIVPGGGANRDSVPATLTPGELVVDRTTTEKLQRFLDNPGMGGSTTTVVLQWKDELVEFIEKKIVERRAAGISYLE